MKIEKKAAKALKKMPQKLAQRFMAAFHAIEEGNAQDLDIKPMQASDYYRLRIGDYRAIYNLDMEVIVIRVGARGDIYK